MSIKTTIQSRIKQAMIEKDKDLLMVLRNMLTGFMQVEKLSGIENIDDAEATNVLEKMLKQGKDSLDVYVSQNRPELATVESYQVGVIEQYLPKKMSVDETRAVIAALIQDGKTNIGAIMGGIKSYGTTIDRGIVAKLVPELLKELAN